MADDDWDTDPDFVSDVNIKKGKSEKSTLIATNTRDLAQIVKTEAQKDSQNRVIQGDYRRGGRVSDMSNDRSKQQVFVAPSAPARNPQIARETRVWGKDDAATVQKQIQSQTAAPAPKPAYTPAPKPAPAPAPKPAAAPKPAPAPAPASKPAPPPPAAKPAPPPPAAKPAPPPEPEPAANEWDQGGYDQGGYDQGGEYNYDQGGGYDQGGYDQGGYDQGGYDQGGYDQGGYDQGGYDQGGYDQGAGGGAQARALYDFAGETETDLPFYAGDVINVLDTSDPGGWWEGELNGARGFFPSNFVEYI